ncbi:hypothetical protein NC99_14670 [Sunxiuqinia dokdonensis]|uniref:Uncharacterized protein n=1 Tax=Sunxiuqinia dokdonensis TaxID=1409788 RepID=A0A0L8VBB1_9BACT|nr:hypothetical protein NC99_14670 [Sunxiuqinia dokdonensis]
MELFYFKPDTATYGAKSLKKPDPIFAVSLDRKLPAGFKDDPPIDEIRNLCE